jgi:hypothetical protein
MAKNPTNPARDADRLEAQDASSPPHQPMPHRQLTGTRRGCGLCRQGPGRVTPADAGGVWLAAPANRSMY